MKLSQNTKGYRTYQTNQKLLVSWWLVQLKNTVFRVWEHWQQAELNRLYMENKKGGWDTKMSVYSSFILLHDPVVKVANVQRGQTDGGTLFSNLPH